ncbi:MAG TPA: crosslink repair DNA glycosylase YcaQ family protein [Microbacteriaceae bacterium]
MTYSWDELAALSLARQFPPIAGTGRTAVAQTVRQIGPIQAQAARAPFLAMAARMPGVTVEDIRSAYDELLIVRGSNIRGTVHTATPQDHALLEVISRAGQRALWARMLRLETTTLEDVWDGLEEFARADWRTPDQLYAFLLGWLEQHDPAANPAIDNDAGRYLAFTHGGLIRRPLVGGWESQGAPEYRAASALLGDRTRILADTNGSLDAIARRYLSTSGPASRHDFAWWSGLGLRIVDATLARLEPETTAKEGPDGRIYYDLVGAPAPVDAPSIRLLPEFDALLCAYGPKARDRFVSPQHLSQVWSRDNGLQPAPMLCDGRLTGYWRLSGSGRNRTCAVTWFTRTRRPRKSELDGPIAALEAAYGITVTGTTLTREQ